MGSQARDRQQAGRGGQRKVPRLKPRPIDGKDGRAGVGPAHQFRQEVEQPGRGDRSQPHPLLGPPQEFLVPREIAHVADRPPGHRERRPAMGTAIAGQLIQQRASRHIVGLAGVPDVRRGRREEHKVLQGVVLGQLVQMPGSPGFRRKTFSMRSTESWVTSASSRTMAA